VPDVEVGDDGDHSVLTSCRQALKAIVAAMADKLLVVVVGENWMWRDCSIYHRTG